MKHLRLLFIVLLIVSCVLPLARSSWEGRLVLLHETFMIDLPDRPAWSPPAVPTYETFSKRFTDLPSVQPNGAQVVRAFRYDGLFLGFALYVGLSSAVCGVLYLLMRRGKRDILLHYALFIGVSVAGAAAACFGLWLMVGGWGAPGILYFSYAGIGLGIFLAGQFWKKQAV